MKTDIHKSKYKLRRDTNFTYQIDKSKKIDNIQYLILM